MKRLLLSALLWTGLAFAPIPARPVFAIGFVNRAQNTVSASAASSASTSAASLTAGNLAVVFLSYQTANPLLTDFGTLTDTAGNTYTQAGTEQTEGTNHLRLYYAYNCLGNGSNVVTVTLTGITGTSNYLTISVRQFSGIATTDPIDGTAKASGSSSSLDTGTVTISASDAVIVAGMESAAGGVWTGGTGYTLDQFANPGDGQYFADEYHIVTASEAATASTGNGTWGLLAAAFKIAGGASPSFVPAIINAPIRGGGVRRRGASAGYVGGVRR